LLSRQTQEQRTTVGFINRAKEGGDSASSCLWNILFITINATGL